MAADDDGLRCANCGEEDRLTGERKPVVVDDDQVDHNHIDDRPTEIITITCDECGLVWDRDPSPSCPTCGRTDVRAAVQAMLEKSRGTQLSVQSMIVVYLCQSCDAERLADFQQTNTPLPPTELPVTPRD